MRILALVLAFGLLADVSSFAQNRNVTLHFPAKRYFRHSLDIKSMNSVAGMTIWYIDPTFVKSELSFSAAYAYPGTEPSTPSQVMLSFATDSDGINNLVNNRELTLILDGSERLSLGTMDLDIANSTVRLFVSTNTYQKIVSANSVSGNVGNFAFEFDFEMIEAMRDLASRMFVEEKVSTSLLVDTLDTGYGEIVIEFTEMRQGLLNSLELFGFITNMTGRPIEYLTLDLRLHDQENREIYSRTRPGEALEIITGDYAVNERKSLGEYGNTVFPERNSFANFTISFSHISFPTLYEFILVHPANSTGLSYKDSDISINFALDRPYEQLKFSLKNGSLEPIEIDWNALSYIDVSGLSNKVIHSGVQYTEKEKPCAPTVVPPTARIEDFLIPVDHIHFSEAMGWSVSSILPSAPDALLLEGKNLGIFLPLTVGTRKVNYMFSLKINRIVF